ncbi:efflux RND transporter permease subunit [Silicimonas algicola]|uniref:HAE1 family hydrophobic/amphiphilic exporter-1 n=1 Tax=Silicimonas algicola TaxID=1826607 RepID=A0A316GEN5_9RHOB|nr:efflux RND transporter permease subunit [Silicimonas algicola]AZQ66680.1 efflux RND transporter permease subunit [Silicimonas algicola]PWK59033.1 HAE1 family hydrophobic/amphiphilic exporter-1 [Silicimonas algicola]
MAVSAQSALSSSTALFVRRPILAFVLSSLIVLAGLAGLFGAEVRELPDVDRPVITVTTEFSGASPETVDREITAQIEGAAGRVAGVKSISSSSRFGRSRVTVEFGDDADLDVAATDMRDAIGRIQNALPDGAEDPRIVKADANAEAVMRIAVTSNRRTAQELSQFAEEVIEDRLISVPGVADLQVYGDRESVFRVDVDQMQLASRGLSLADVSTTLRNVAFDAPAGALNSSSQSIVVRTTATVSSPAEFEALAIRDGVTVGDVATVTLGPAPGESVLRANGQTGLGMGIIRQAQSNTLEISQSVRAVVDELQAILPDDISVFVTSDDAVFINGSIREALNTLGIAVAIVIAIIFVFLRDVRATLIPAVTLPVALVGTLAAIYMVGFSVNILTLLALVLATGMVVDDAIVVLENIVRRRSEGMGARAAAVLGTQQVFFAVVTTTATLAAVFIPLSFLPGQTGGLFREFGFTLAMSVLLSSVVALTLCPVLASRLLKGHSGKAEARGPMIWLGRRLASLYALALRFCLAMPLLVIVFSIGFAIVAALSMGGIRQELTPPEDRSLALLRVSAPQGVSLDYTAGKMREIEDLVEPLRASGEVTNVFSIAGTGSDNSGFMVMSLAPWEERSRSQQEIVGQINGMVGEVIGVRAFAIQPNSLGIRGAGRGLTVALTGNNYQSLADSAQAIIDRMEENPAFGRVSLGYETTQPQLFIEVDRDRASDIGVNIDGLGEALQAVLDGRTVGTVFIDDRSFSIKMVSTSDPVNDPGDLERIFVQAGNGQMVPISSFVTLQERAVAPELSREAQMRAVEISATLTPELSLGDAYSAVQEIADEVLPEQQRIVPLAEAATLSETSSGLFVTFGFAFLVVFLVLSAQFESFVSAIIIMATVPLGLACAVFALLITGGSLNVYSQIGLVLLIGIMAKNGILIVEFANQLRDQGQSVRDAIFEASTVRLRPVMMTMASTVLGGVPLIFSSGAGAEAREALGWIIVGGLGLATLFTLFLTPVAYLVFARLSRPKAEEEAILVRELGAATGGTPAE